MKFNSLRPTLCVSSNLLHIAAAALLFCAATAPASQLIWDPLNNGGTAPASGNWDTTNTIWFNGASDVAWTQTSTTTGLNGAVFGGLDGTWNITNDVSQIAMTNLTINNSGYAFYGDPLDISSGDLMILAPGKTVSFYCNLAADNNAKDYIAGAGSVVNIFGNVLAQQPKFIGASTSAYYLSGVNTPSVLYNLAPVYLTNGSITTSASFFIGYSQTVAGTAYTTGAVTISGGASATQNGNVLMIGRGGGNGTLTLVNGTVNVGTTASHDLAVCYDASGGEIGNLNVYGGTLNVGASGLTSKLDFFDTAGSGAGAVATMIQTNGVVNAWGGVIFGAASGNFAGGTASLTNLGGSLYVGSGGINRGAGGGPPAINVSLTGGTVGALANWSSALPMILAPDNGNTTFQCGDSLGDTYNISLSGALSGAGGLNVTGTGTLTLSGTNTYAGTTVVSNGTLAVATSSSPTNGVVTVDGSTGSPTLSVRVSNRGQYWSTGTLTYTSGSPTADFQYSSLTPSPSVAALQVNGDLVFSVTPTVTVEGSALATGTYPLIQYTGNLVGTAPSSVLLPSNVTGTLLNNTASKTIELTISQSPYLPAVTWAVSDGVWDTTTFNWKQFGVPTNWANGDQTLFDDTASGTSPITVTLNTTVTPGSVTANNSAKNYIINGTGSIAGSTGLAILNTGTMTLGNANTYTGGTVLDAGQLNINNGGNSTASAIGAGPLTINAGALDNTSGSNVALQASIPETWNASFTYVGSSNNFNTGPGAVSMLSSLSVSVNSNNFTVGGPISDNGANLVLTKSGNGALTLPVGNTIGGGVTLQSGLLNLGDPNATGGGLFTIISGSIDNISGAPLTLSPGSYQWVNSFTVVGTANLDLGFPAILDNSGPLTVTVLSNTFSTEGNITSGNSVITKAGNGTWIIGGGYANTHQLQLSVAAGEVDLDKSENAIGLGSSGLTIQSNGLVVDIIGSQIYHGSGTYVPVVLNGGVFDLNGQAENVDEFSITNGGTLRNSAVGGVSTLSIDTANTVVLGGTNCQFTVTDPAGILNIDTIISGSGTLVKNGVGLLNLDSNSTYTGSTIINSGTLALPGVSSISASADIDLASPGAALDLSGNTDTNSTPTPLLTLLSGQTLSGFGVVTGLVETVSGAALAPGSASAIGTLTVTGVAGANSLNGITMMKLNGTSHTSDKLSVSGSLVYGGTLALTNLPGTTVTAGESFTLFNAARGYSGAFASIVPARPDFPAFGLAWNTNNLAVNGTLSIVTAGIPSSPKISGTTLSGTTLSIRGTNGVANEPFVLLESPTLAAPLADWTPVLTNSFDASGNFNVSIGVTNQPSEFFTLSVQ